VLVDKVPDEIQDTLLAFGQILCHVLTSLYII
jgi:hypothetical protein